MGVAALKWTRSMIESALFRSGGVPLAGYAYGPALPPDASKGFRNYKGGGKGVGHVYIHVSGGGDETVGQNSGLANRSKYADLPTTLSVIKEILNSAAGQAGLQQLDATPGLQVWIHGSHAVPIAGTYYGYAPHQNTLRKILTASINMRSHGDALFISSSYPEGLQALAVNPVTPVVPVP